MVGLPKCWALSRCAARLASPRSTAAALGSFVCVERDAPVHLEGADRRHDHDGRGVQAGRPALEVEELLAPQVEREPRLGDGIVGQRERHARGEHRVAAVGDVGERAAVDEGRHRLRGLHQVRQDRLVQDRGHRADHAKLLRQDRLAVHREADEDPVQPGAQVGRRVRQAEDGHDLARRGDVEAALAGNALRPSSQADDDVPQGPVVHVQDALPQHLGRVELEIAEMDVIVDRRGQQVVGGGDRVEIAGELEVDRVRGLDLAGPAAGRPPLRPKTGPIDGCRSARAARLPIRRSPWARPIDVVVLPSPAGVGVIAETRISLPGLRPEAAIASSRTLALSRP